MCSQMTDVVMGLLWLTEVALWYVPYIYTPGGTDDHAHRLHLEGTTDASGLRQEASYSCVSKLCAFRNMLVR